MGRVLPGIVVSRLVRTTCLLTVLAAPLARAQGNRQSTLTVTPALAFTTPAVADYLNGYVCAGSVNLDVAKTKGPTASDAVYVRSTATTMSSTPLPTYSLAVGDLQFTTSASGCSAASTWTSVPISTSPPAQIFSGNTPFNITVYFRVLLSWANDRGGVTYTIPDLRFWDNLPSANPP